MHHYVPQFLLRGFANRAQQVACVDLGADARRFVLNVNRAAAQRDYYTIRSEVGRDDQIAEKLLGQVESRFAQVITHLLDGRFSSPVGDLSSIRMLIGSFAMIQWGRTPVGREILSLPLDAELKRQIRDMSPEDLRAMLAIGEDSSSGSAGEELLTVLADESRFHFVDRNQNTIRAALTDWVPRQQTFAERQMCLFRWTRRHLILSDHPVLTFPVDWPEAEATPGQVEPSVADFILIPCPGEPHSGSGPHRRCRAT